MPKYAVTVTIQTDDYVDPEDVAAHVCEAVSHWGGQYHPDDPLFSQYVRVRATCRGITFSDIPDKE